MGAASGGNPGCWQTAGLILGLAGLVAMFVTGYVAFTSDHTQYLLLPYRQIDAGFIQHDWLTWQTTHYHVGFALLVRALEALAPGHLAAAMGAAWFAGLMAYLWGLHRIARALGGDLRLLTWMVLGHALYSSIGVGDTNTFGDMLLPTHLAFAALAHAVAFLLAGRALGASACLGVATFFHVSYGVLGLPLVLAMLFLERRLGWRALTAAVAPCAVLAWPNAWPVAQAFATTFAPGAETQAFELAFQVRGAHHYDPRSFSPGIALLWSTPVALAVGLLTLRRARESGDALALTRARRLLVLCLALLAAGLVAGWTGWPTFLNRFFVWRFAPLALVLAYAVLGQALLTTPGRARGVLLMLAPLGALIVLRHGSNNDLPAGVIVAALLVVCTILLRSAWGVRGGALALGAVALAGLAGSTVSAAGGYRPAPRPLVLAPHDPLSDWLRTHTPSDAVLVVPPDVEGIRIRARRAIVVNVKGFPLGKGDQIRAWQERIEDVCGVRLDALESRGYAIGAELRRYYLARPARDLAQVMHRYGATFLVTSTEHAGLADFPAAGFTRVFAHANTLVFHWRDA